MTNHETHRLPLQARFRLTTLLVLGSLAVAAGAALAATGGGSGGSSAAPCKAAGILYLGSTVAGGPICLTVSQNRKALRDFGFQVRCKKGGVSTFFWSPPATRIVKGAFTFTGAVFDSRVTLKGKLTGTHKAAGTLRTKAVNEFGCTSNTLRWSASPAE